MDDGADVGGQCLRDERRFANGQAPLRFLDVDGSMFGIGVGRNDLLAPQKLVEIPLKLYENPAIKAGFSFLEKQFLNLMEGWFAR